jgi:dihydrofolate reductase
MISLIVAFDENFSIGKNNCIPWKFSQDLINFKNYTTNNICIMGRKTWESLPEKFRPLPDRVNIIVSTQYFQNPNKANLNYSNVFFACSLEHSLNISKKLFPNKDIIFIGGNKIYKEALDSNIIERMIITHVNGTYDADTSFPKINLSDWKSKELFVSNEFKIIQYDK